MVRLCYMLIYSITGDVLIIWLRWYLPGFSTIKLLVYPFQLISIFSQREDTLRLCKHLDTPLISTLWFQHPLMIFAQISCYYDYN